MVDDDGGEVVEAGPRVGAPRLVEVGEEVVGHVEAAQRELHVRVQLRPREGRPPETLQVQAQHLQIYEICKLNGNFLHNMVKQGQHQSIHGLSKAFNKDI